MQFTTAEKALYDLIASQTGGSSKLVMCLPVSVFHVVFSNYSSK